MVSPCWYKLVCAGETHGSKLNHNNESGAREIVYMSCVRCVITYEEKWIGKWRLELLKAVFFFLAKIRQKVTLIQISGEKPLFFQKRVAKFLRALIFLGESDITSLCIGYTFNDPIQSCRRWSRNLPSGLATAATLQNWKKNTSWKLLLVLTCFLWFHEVYCVPPESYPFRICNLKWV